MAISVESWESREYSSLEEASVWVEGYDLAQIFKGVRCW